MILCPARLEPIFSPRPWGSLSLSPLFPEKTNLTEPLGEAWMTGSDCRFASGPFAGQKLGAAWSTMPAEWTGTLAERSGLFPLLVKFIFAEDKLSVQVHPDDEYARQHENAACGRGKTEMWYALRAGPGAEVLVGLKPHVTLDQFKRSLADGSTEDCLEHVPLRAGDAIFVPAGTAHTIGPGLVLCEIQEHSDLTYRVYDYNRRDAEGRARELHIEKALDVIRFGEQRGGKIDPVHVTRGRVEETHFVACRYFATEKWGFSESVTAATSREHFDLMIILEGTGQFEWDDSRAEYAPAQVWMFPAALGEYGIKPSARTALLRTYVPRDSGEFMSRLKERGVPESELSRLVYP
ncbi:MAG TPA: type I phosphomannose isomerase catalytic subunit [Candidatus Acidoferrales bacterium]|nr:type I phosphomannose isomerase catalytic subunit [Candidatus Acidoferrales bacterium]